MKPNILIPMAGLGSRFIKEGFKVPKQIINIKDKHLNHLKSRITTKETSTHSEQKLLTLQQKLKNKPTKLAIVMQAIFDPPKSQGI